MAFVDAGFSRGHVNACVQRVVGIFRSAASEELVPGSLVHDLATVEPLRRGRTKTPEGKAAATSHSARSWRTGPVATRRRSNASSGNLASCGRSGIEPLVAWHAGRIKRPASIDAEDLIQEGLLAVVRYADRHDPTRGEFSGFASIVARRTMLNYIDQHRTVIRVPKMNSRCPEDRERARNVGVLQVDKDDALGDHHVTDAEQRAQHNEMMDRAGQLLDDHEYRMFELWLEGWSGPAIAKELGVGLSTPGTVCRRAILGLQARYPPERTEGKTIVGGMVRLGDRHRCLK